MQTNCGCSRSISIWRPVFSHNQNILGQKIFGRAVLEKLLSANFTVPGAPSRRVRPAGGDPRTPAERQLITASPRVRRIHSGWRPVCGQTIWRAFAGEPLIFAQTHTVPGENLGECSSASPLSSRPERRFQTSEEMYVFKMHSLRTSRAVHVQCSRCGVLLSSRSLVRRSVRFVVGPSGRFGLPFRQAVRSFKIMGTNRHEPPAGRRRRALDTHRSLYRSHICRLAYFPQ